jgi:hypothetical protein
MAKGEGLKPALDRMAIHPMDFANYIYDSPEAYDKYMRVRSMRTEIQVDDLVRIADEDPDPHRARIRIDTRKWIASKMNPKLYGEKLDVNVNQTVDIASILTEARARAVTELTQRAEITGHSENSATDNQSVIDATLEENIEDDIFS